MQHNPRRAIASPLARPVAVSRLTDATGARRVPEWQSAARRAKRPGMAWEETMRAVELTRRRFIATAAASSAAIAIPYVRHARAAGKLAIGFWDHWVPGANNTLTALVNEW